MEAKTAGGSGSRPRIRSAPFSPTMMVGALVLDEGTRGMTEAEMDRIADLISAALQTPEDETALARIKQEVEELCREFPLYPPPA